MTEKRDFYVYEHIRGDTGEVFYVGKGRAGRARKMTRSNQHHQNIVIKMQRDGETVSVRLVRENIPEPCAFSLERALIAVRKARGAPLVNRTEGGEGSCGRSPSRWPFRAASSRC